jgi:hypothetical protein
MKKILLALKIVQQKQFKDPFNRTYTKKRLNPFNPLTYILIILWFVFGLIMFGVYGLFKEIDFSDLKFKYK